MTRVAVTGAGGKMGSEVCRAVLGAPDLTLVAAIDPKGAESGSVVDTGLASGPLPMVSTIRHALPADPEVVIDFTFLDASREILAVCAEEGLHAVVGTTGFDAADQARFDASFTSSNLLIAPNFAVGAVMMMHVAALAAPFFETAEVIELHHNNKRDAPSGTAMNTVSIIADAKRASGSEFAEDPTEQEIVPGARGGRVDGVSVHSVRMHGLVAHQEVIFGTTGETLTIRHDLSLIHI